MPNATPARIGASLSRAVAKGVTARPPHGSGSSSVWMVDHVQKPVQGFSNTQEGYEAFGKFSTLPLFNRL